jgi:hypothetical protein
MRVLPGASARKLVACPAHLPFSAFKNDGRGDKVVFSAATTQQRAVPAYSKNPRQSEFAILCE